MKRILALAAILLVGTFTLPDNLSAHASGAQDYLVKPCRIEKLEETIDNLLGDEC
jgi:DNA-binding NtrC family response regulator